MSESIVSNELKTLKFVAAAEGWSFLILLLIAMPLKYMADMPQPVRVVGMIHGILFVLYVINVLQAKFEYDWSLKKLFLALLASIIPLGTFYANKRLFNTER